MKQIIIFCDGGLGNRMNCLIGGLLLAKKTNRTPIINWPSNTWCGSSFDKLFSNTEYKIFDKDINNMFLENINNMFLIHVNQTKLNLPKTCNSKTTQLHDIQRLEDDTIVYYHNSIPNYFSLDEILVQLNELKVHPYILSEVSLFCTQYNINKNTIGIHLRRTDAVSLPTTDQVLKLANENKHYNFYICSDDPNTESILTKNDNIVSYPKTEYVEKYSEGEWNSNIIDNENRRSTYNVNRSEISVIQAFIDLLILSKTNIQFASKSTFVKLALLYNKLTH